MDPQLNYEQKNDKIQHQGAVEEVIDDVVEAGVGKDNAAIANASVAHALNSTFSDTEVEAALNALGGKVNAILDVLRNNGIIASS